MRAELNSIRPTFPDDVRDFIMVDTSEFVNASIEEVIRTFFEALLLVLIVVTLFLQSWRATLIPMLAVPVSLLATFMAYAALGFSVNTLSLFGMVLAIGIVVDDAIVVVEAVEHNMEHDHLSALEATRKAMDEVSGPVVAIALVLVAVFVPMAFIPGITGQLYKQFALTVAVSVMFSALVALTLTPALCALLLKPKKPGGGRGPIAAFFRAFNRGFVWVTDHYGQGVNVLVRRSFIIVGVMALVFVACNALFARVPTGFVPDEDQGYFYLQGTLPDAASQQRSQLFADQVAQIITKQPGVDSVRHRRGLRHRLVGHVVERGVLHRPSQAVGGAPRRRAARTSDHAGHCGSGHPDSAGRGDSVQPARVAGARQHGRLLVHAAGPQRRHAHPAGGDGEPVHRRGPEAAGDRPHLHHVLGVDAGLSAGSRSRQGTQARRAGECGLQRAAVVRRRLPGERLHAVRPQLQGDDPGRSDVPRAHRDAAHAVRAQRQGRHDPARHAGQVREHDSARAFSSATTSTRRRRLGGAPAPGYSSGEVIAALRQVAADVLPQGYGYEWSGQTLQEIEAGNRAALVFGLSVVVVFLFLAALYESWAIPFAVLLAVPLGVMGALASLLIVRQDFNVYGQIGLVTLVGLAAKNAILIVEFAQLNRDRGMSLRDAAIDAAKLRLRPILMTSFAFILGCIPLALASGAGAASKIAVGIAVVGGMAAATFFAVFTVPVLFVLIRGLSERIGGAPGPVQTPAPASGPGGGTD